jgi:hypothetical protein
LVKKPKPAIGIIIFGIFLVITSFLQIQKFSSFNNYRIIFQHLPDNLIIVRYFISIGLRILGFIAGCGLLFRKEFARKLSIYLAIFTICTIYWKHPYPVVANSCRIVYYTMYNSSGATQFVLPAEVKTVTLLALIVFYLIDIIFFSVLIYYFTRPRVREQFN